MKTWTTSLHWTDHKCKCGKPAAWVKEIVWLGAVLRRESFCSDHFPEGDK